MNATNLTELLNELRSMTREELESTDLSSLPTFGGEEPNLNQGEIWSWDETSLLVGTQVGTGEFAGDFEIICREDV